VGIAATDEECGGGWGEPQKPTALDMALERQKCLIQQLRVALHARRPRGNVSPAP
jgi:hypothetical protein